MWTRSFSTLQSIRTNCPVSALSCKLNVTSHAFQVLRTSPGGRIHKIDGIVDRVMVEIISD